MLVCGIIDLGFTGLKPEQLVFLIDDNHFLSAQSLVFYLLHFTCTVTCFPSTTQIIHLTARTHAHMCARTHAHFFFLVVSRFFPIIVYPETTSEKTANHGDVYIDGFSKHLRICRCRDLNLVLRECY